MNVVKKVQRSDCRCFPTWNLRKKLKVKVFIRPMTVSKSKCHYLNKKSAVALQKQKTITDEIVSPVYPRTRKSTESWMQMPTVRDVLEYHHRQSQDVNHAAWLFIFCSSSLKTWHHLEPETRLTFFSAYHVPYRECRILAALSSDLSSCPMRTPSTLAHSPSTWNTKSEPPSSVSCRWSTQS